MDRPTFIQPLKKLLSLALVVFFVWGCSDIQIKHIPIEQPIDVDFSEQELLNVALEMINTTLFTEADSLLNALEIVALNTDNPTLLAKVKILEGQNYLFQQKYNRGLETLLEAVELSDYAGTLIDRAISRKWLSDAYNRLGRSDLDLETIEEAIEVYEEGVNETIRATLLATKAQILMDRRRFPEALEMFLQLVDIYERQENNANLGVMLNSIGLLFMNINQFETAIDYFRRAYEANYRMNERYNLSMNMNNIAIMLNKLGETEAAIDTLQSAIRINIELGLPIGEIRNRYNLASAYVDIRDFDRAYEEATLGLNLSRELDFHIGIMYHSSVLGKIYFETGNLVQSQRFTDMAFELSEQLSNEEVMAEMTLLYSSIQEARGNHSQALAYFKDYFDRNEKLQKERTVAQLEELRIQYDVEKHQEQVGLLQENLNIQEKLNQNQRMLLIFLLIGVVITLFLLIIFMVTQRRLRSAIRKLELQKNQIFLKSVELERLNNDRNALLGVIVHDLKNPIATISGFVEVITTNGIDDENLKYLQIIESSAQKMQGLVNALLNINKIEKEDVSLGSEITELGKLFDKIVMEYRMHATRKLIILHEEIENITAYTHPVYVSRIAENLLSNAIKFCPKGSQVNLSVREDYKDNFLIIVDDNGPGINERDRRNLFKMFKQLSAKPTDGETSSGVGLYTVQLLAEKLGGTITLDHKDEPGARFVCAIPMNKKMLRKALQPEKSKAVALE